MDGQTDGQTNTLTDKQKDRWTYIHTDRQTVEWMERQIDRQMDRQTHIQRERCMADGQTDRQMDRQTGRWIDCHRDRQTERWMSIWTDGQTDRQDLDRQRQRDRQTNTCTGRVKTAKQTDKTIYSTHSFLELRNITTCNSYFVICRPCCYPQHCLPFIWQSKQRRHGYTNV